MKLQDRLKEMRTSRDLTLKRLAERTGFSLSYLSNLERGRTIPPLVTLATLATAVDMTVIDVLTGVDFAGELTDASLPPGLAALLDDVEYRQEITPEWIAMLSKIHLAGRRPQSKRAWLGLYLHLQRLLAQEC